MTSRTEFLTVPNNTFCFWPDGICDGDKSPYTFFIPDRYDGASVARKRIGSLQNKI